MPVLPCYPCFAGRKEHTSPSRPSLPDDAHPSRDWKRGTCTRTIDRPRLATRGLIVQGSPVTPGSEPLEELGRPVQQVLRVLRGDQLADPSFEFDVVSHEMMRFCASGPHTDTLRRRSRDPCSRLWRRQCQSGLQDSASQPSGHGVRDGCESSLSRCSRDGQRSRGGRCWEWCASWRARSVLGWLG